VSDWIEKDGKKYFEESYVVLANKTAMRLVEENEKLQAIERRYLAMIANGWRIEKYGSRFRLWDGEQHSVTNTPEAALDAAIERLEGKCEYKGPVMKRVTPPVEGEA
jgi:hypothetical protein